MLFDISYQTPHSFARRVASTLIVDSAKGPLDRVRLGAVGGQEQHLEAGMGSQPLLALPRIMTLGVGDDDGETGKRGIRVRPVQRGQQVQTQPGGLAIPDTMLGRARRASACPRPV